MNISHAKTSENTETPLRFDILVRICYTLPPEERMSCMWARAEAFASNCLNLRGAIMQEGEVITGILTPSYGKHLTAVFNTWRPSTLTHWKKESIGPKILASNTNEGKNHKTPTSERIFLKTNKIISRRWVGIQKKKVATAVLRSKF